MFSAPLLLHLSHYPFPKASPWKIICIIVNVKCEYICNLREFCKMTVPQNLYVLLRIQVRWCSAPKTRGLFFHCGLQEERRKKANCSHFMKFPFGNVKLSLNAAFKGLKNKLFQIQNALKIPRIFHACHHQPRWSSEGTLLMIIVNFDFTAILCIM